MRFGDFFAGRLAAQLLHELAAGAHQLVDRLDHVHRIRIVRAWSAMARVMAWRIHHVAYVENLYPRRHSNLSTAFIRPMFAFLNQVEELQSAVGIFLRDRNNQSKVWPRSIPSWACSASASPR